MLETWSLRIFLSLLSVTVYSILLRDWFHLTTEKAEFLDRTNNLKQAQWNIESSSGCETSEIVKRVTVSIGARAQNETEWKRPTCVTSGVLDLTGETGEAFWRKDAVGVPGNRLLVFCFLSSASSSCSLFYKFHRREKPKHEISGRSS